MRKKSQKYKKKEKEELLKTTTHLSEGNLIQSRVQKRVEESTAEKNEKQKNIEEIPTDIKEIKKIIEGIRTDIKEKKMEIKDKEMEIKEQTKLLIVSKNEQEKSIIQEWIKFNKERINRLDEGTKELNAQITLMLPQLIGLEKEAKEQYSGEDMALKFKDTQHLLKYLIDYRDQLRKENRETGQKLMGFGQNLMGFGQNLKFSGRQKLKENLIQALRTMRFAHLRGDFNKENFPLLVATGSPGIGKTRSLYEIFEIIKQEAKNDLALILNDYKFIHIFTQFGNGYSPSSSELQNAGKSIFMRVFYSYFLKNLISFTTFLDQFSKMNIETSIYSIKNLLVEIQKDLGGGKVCFILTMDEIQHTFREKDYLTDLTKSLQGPYYQPLNDIVLIPFMAGTLTLPLSELVRSSGMLLSRLPLPLLTEEDVKEIVIDTWGTYSENRVEAEKKHKCKHLRKVLQLEENVPDDLVIDNFNHLSQNQRESIISELPVYNPEWVNSKPFRHSLSLYGQHPRTLRAILLLYNQSILANRPFLLSHSSIISLTHLGLNDEVYLMEYYNQFLIYHFLRVPISSLNDKIDLGSKFTFDELEGMGLIKIEEKKTENVREQRVYYLRLYTHTLDKLLNHQQITRNQENLIKLKEQLNEKKESINSNPKAKGIFSEFSEIIQTSQNYSSFEKFCALYIATRYEFFKMTYNNITYKNFFNGAFFGSKEVSEIIINLKEPIEYREVTQLSRSDIPIVEYFQVNQQGFDIAVIFNVNQNGEPKQITNAISCKRIFPNSPASSTKTKNSISQTLEFFRNTKNLNYCFCLVSTTNANTIKEIINQSSKSESSLEKKEKKTSTEEINNIIREEKNKIILITSDELSKFFGSFSDYAKYSKETISLLQATTEQYKDILDIIGKEAQILIDYGKTNPTMTTFQEFIDQVKNSLSQETINKLIENHDKILLN